MFWCDLVDINYMIQDYVTGTGSITVKNVWKIFVNKSRESIESW